MARTDTFHCSVITPERAVLETDATSVVFPAHDGEIGILPGRAPLLYRMGAGELRVESPQGNQVLFVDGGFAQMVENRLTLLTEAARKIEEIDPAAVEKQFTEAHSMPMRTDAEFKARQRVLRSAQAQRQILARRGSGRAA
ncbi:MAG TPA: ATP synthase F1 subunit epsilon [Thermoanaerobaculia bacterium]